MGVALWSCYKDWVEHAGQASELPANLFHSIHLRSWITAAEVNILDRVTVMRLGMHQSSGGGGYLTADERKQLWWHRWLQCLLGVFSWGGKGEGRGDFGWSSLTCCKNESASTGSSQTEGRILSAFWCRFRFHLHVPEPVFKKGTFLLRQLTAG